MTAAVHHMYPILQLYQKQQKIQMIHYIWQNREHFKHQVL